MTNNNKELFFNADSFVFLLHSMIFHERKHALKCHRMKPALFSVL